jgi:hypothetical protein
MHRSSFSRRPSAALVIASAALFISLGGVGWAATQLAANSVGTRQLRNGAVTRSKLKNGAVSSVKIARHAIGVGRINSAQVQARVRSACTGGTAMAQISRKGAVTCTPVLPQAFTTVSKLVTVGTASTTVATKSLSAGNYLAIATPYASVTNTAGASQVRVTCMLSFAGDRSQTRTVVVEAGTPGGQQVQAIPILVPGTVKSGTAGLSLACDQVPTPPSKPATVTVQATLSAMTIASNG